MGRKVGKLLGTFCVSTAIDRSESAIGYYQPRAGDGGVIFVNSTRGVEFWPKIADVVDAEQQFQDVFHDLIRKLVASH